MSEGDIKCFYNLLMYYKQIDFDTIVYYDTDQTKELMSDFFFVNNTSSYLDTVKDKILLMVYEISGEYLLLYRIDPSYDTIFDELKFSDASGIVKNKQISIVTQNLDRKDRKFHSSYYVLLFMLAVVSCEQEDIKKNIDMLFIDETVEKMIAKIQKFYKETTETTGKK